MAKKTVEDIVRHWEARDKEVGKYAAHGNMLFGRDGLLDDWYKDVGVLLQAMGEIPEGPYGVG